MQVFHGTEDNNLFNERGLNEPQQDRSNRCIVVERKSDIRALS